MVNASRGATLTAAITAGLELLSERLRVSMPGIVTKYDRATKRADVQPAISKRVRGRKDPVNLPIIRNIQIAFPQTKNAIIRLPVAVGDYVEIIFYDRAAQNWLDGKGEIRESLDVRKHNINDAYALLGGGPREGGVYDDPGADSSIVVALGKEYIEIEEGGGINIGKGATKAAARVGDTVVVTAASDPAFIAWMVAVSAASVPPVTVIPTTVAAKITTGSDNVKVG